MIFIYDIMIFFNGCIIIIMIFLKTKIMIFQEGIFMIFYDTGIAMQTIVYKTGVMNTSRMSFFSPSPLLKTG